MSTRANIKVIDGHSNELWFYRHSDGYPEGAMPLIKTFMEKLASGEIRDNISQASGWLIILGHDEYSEISEKYDHAKWKVGSIEPTTGEHGDIEYLYEINLKEKIVQVFTSGEDGKMSQFVEVHKYDEKESA